jgi:hypothetical protein
MANYLVNNCSNDETYIVSASTTLSIGEFISFNVGEDAPFCGIVDSEIEGDNTHTYLHSYESCCDCYSGESYLSLQFQTCEGTEFSYSLSAFCETYGSNPREDKTFMFSNTVDNSFFCAEFLFVNDASPEENTYFPEEGPFNSCTECGREIERSANTEYNVCVYCCDCGSTGVTLNSVVAPHPEWTDGYGTQVTQENMIVLGGIKGLNS